MLRSIILVLCTSTWAYTQCPTVDFTIPSSACKNADISPQGMVANAVSYSWDFCDESLLNNPSSITSVTDPLVAEPYDLRSFEENGEYYMISVNYVNGKVLRYDFGTSFSNSPVLTDLGNFGVIVRPLGMDLWKESNSVYALIVTESGALFRLNFGNSIENTPSVVQVLDVTDLFNHRHIRITRENGTVLALIAGGSHFVSVLNFGNSIQNNPTLTPISIPNSPFITGLDLGIECNDRYALISGYGSGLQLLSFGNSYLNTPIITQLSSIPDNLLWGLSLTKSGGNYHAFMFSDNIPKGILRVDFGSSLSNPSPIKVNLGTFSGIDLAIGLTIAASGSTNFCASLNYTNGHLNVLEFPKDCELTGNYPNELNPAGIAYSAEGSYSITLTAKGANDEVVSVTKPIVITNLEAPSLIINESGNCLANGITFTGLQQSGEPLSTFLWNFGDGNSASGQNPTHLYAAIGTYDVALEATASNGCLNRLTKAVPVYAAPVSDFSLPSANPVCTNQNYFFDNTSNVDPGFTPAWEWRVNETLVSSTEDLTHAFSSAVSQEIRLKASIPGCEDEMIKTIASVQQGPAVDFTWTGQCEDQLVAFTNGTQGTITGYSWDFDDGQNSTDTNPTHIFSNPGVYDVVLTASNIAGCNNTISKQVTIYSIPQVNFAPSLPPFSCNATPTQFNDLTPNPTDSNIASWQWNFGDAGSSQNTSTLRDPQHMYTDAGNYDVSLTVSTNFSCSSTLQLPVTISQIPVADFNYTAPCEDEPVNFSDTSAGTIQSWNWMIGSSSYSTQNPTHTFVNSGNENAMLTVTASNNCISSVNKTIVVPNKLAPDFTVSKNCVDQQTLFTDITNATADPVSSYSWDFGGLGTASGSSANFTFSNTGNVNVTLTLTTLTGCVYPVPKLVNVMASPQANFTATPEVGAPPLAVQFTNTSVNATSYRWTFNDGNDSTSTQVSPLFTYQNLGRYEATLTASNAENCSHTFSRTIDVVTPVVDVSLSGLELMELQNGAIKPAITIFNQGNTPVSNLGLLLDISGLSIREHVDTTILPNSSFRHVLQFEIPDPNKLQYFCVEADVEDITPGDNKTCLNLERLFTSFPPYPNPANGELHADWIVMEDGIVTVSLINAMGQEFKNFQIDSSEGLNPFILNTEGIVSGAYLLRIKYRGFTSVYRVFISE